MVLGRKDQAEDQYWSTYLGRLVVQVLTQAAVSQAESGLEMSPEHEVRMSQRMEVEVDADFSFVCLLLSERFPEKVNHAIFSDLLWSLLEKEYHAVFSDLLWS